MLSFQWSVVIVGLLAAALLFPIIPQAYAQTCVELGNCPINGNPLEWMIYPLVLEMGNWAYVLLWGMVLGVVYMRNHNVALVGLVGLVVFAAFIGTTTYTGSSTSQVFYWGFILLAVGIGATLFYLIWTRLRAP